MSEMQPPISLLDLTERLIPMADPKPVPMVPQTAGWAVLGAAAAAGLIWLGWRAWRRFRANAYRRAALRRLERAGENPKALATLLRQTALAAFPRRDVAALAGDDWLRFLDETSGINEFSSGEGQVFAHAPYKPFAAARPEAAALARYWIRRHRRPPC